MFIPHVAAGAKICDFFVELWSNTRQMTTCYNLDLWPLRSPRMAVMRVVLLHPCREFEVRRPSRSEDTTDSPSQH